MLLKLAVKVYIAFKFKKIDYFELYMEHSLKKEEKGTR
jgi:hypothetical protein